MDIRNLLFKARGFTPLPIVLIIIYQAQPHWLGALIGLTMALSGEIIRLHGVRAAGGRTRTRQVGAKELCTWGLFAHVRNPLYIGNALIYFGLVVFAGGRWFLPLMLVALVYFVFQYGMIISLEEETLTRLFGAQYEEYKAHVPRLWPRLKPWAKSDEPHFLSWGKVFHTEKSTLLTFGFFILAILIKVLILHAR